MKDQTKAILASTMILALALSSVVGVTYSWFSDTEETEFEIGTGNINIKTSLENESTQQTVANLGIQLISPGLTTISHKYVLSVSNPGENTTPAIVSVDVILERYFTPYYEDDVRKYGAVYAIYNDDKSIDRFETTGVSGDQYAFFYSDKDRQTNTTGGLSFGDNKERLQQSTIVNLGINPVYIAGSNELFKDKSDSGYYDIRYVEYKYHVGELVVNGNISGEDSPTLSFVVNYRDDYVPKAVKELYVRTTATQINADCHVTQFEYDSETSKYKASSMVNGTKPEIFLNSSFNIIIKTDSLPGINKIEIVASRTSDSIDFSIKYYDADNNRISFDPPGDLTIQFSSNGVSGMIKAPASKSTYSISIGGQTS